MPGKVATEDVVRHLRRAVREVEVVVRLLPPTSPVRREMQTLVSRMDDGVRNLRREERRQASARGEQDWQDRRDKEARLSAIKAKVTDVE